LEPFCSSTFDHVTTREKILELKERKTMPAYLLNSESLSLDEVTIIDEEFKDELEKDHMKEGKDESKKKPQADI
jgi:hypothetical protein